MHKLFPQLLTGKTLPVWTGRKAAAMAQNLQDFCFLNQEKEILRAYLKLQKLSQKLQNRCSQSFSAIWLIFAFCVKNEAFQAQNP
ncbi:hypothetical protein [Pseudanabaena sp. FACHB-2040]|uniref:hypothetical protein n=1 Tax=Pseudanabaena sp. FACHB-2040 TaxID=2692859 RepID=UPI001683E936|nr:hypothetical protein [Pseudanabaena sp. FACHB-2040]MBD2261128.1 hypothetical protein [Pseudanabaena sp. FACHB-2040]